MRCVMMPKARYTGAGRIGRSGLEERNLTRTPKYAHYRDNNWYVGDGRVEVYSVIAAWLQGYSPE